MKKIKIISWIAFIFGLVFRLFHITGASYLLTIGSFVLLIHSIIYLLKHYKEDLLFSLLNLSFSTLTIYLLFRFQYWPSGIYIAGFSFLFILGSILTIIYFILLIIGQIRFKVLQIVLIIYFVFTIIISYTDTYRIYYFFHLNTTIHQKSRKVDYYSWDKYSWFLYNKNMIDKSKEANLNAQNALDYYLKNTKDIEASRYLIIIKQHYQKIIDNNWNNYP